MEQSSSYHIVMRTLSLMLIRKCYTAANHLSIRNAINSKHVDKFLLSKHQHNDWKYPGLTLHRSFTNEVVRLHSSVIPRPSFDGKNPYLAPIKVNRELHKAGDRSCMHVELDLEESNVQYEAGDHLVVYPVNDVDLVERLGKLCDCNLDEVFSLANDDVSDNHPLTSLITYRAALTHYLEITAHPSVDVIKELVEYCSDKEDKELLKLMCSSTPEGEAKYQEWIEEATRNIVHVLEDIPSCRPLLDRICELIPRLQPRFYSISSSPKV